VKIPGFTQPKNGPLEDKTAAENRSGLEFNFRHPFKPRLFQ